MQKNKKIIIISIVALLFSITSIGIAFAAMTQEIKIGFADGTFNPATWNVRIDTESLIKQTTGEATGTFPSINSTTIGTYSVNLTKPGDSVTYTFDVENRGGLDAQIGSFSKPNPECTGTVGGSQGIADANLICNGLIYTLTNDNKEGDAVGLTQVLSKNSGVPTKQTMVLHIEYPNTISETPTASVTITFPQIVITYIQV